MTEEPRTVTDEANEAYDIVKNMCHLLPHNAPGPVVYSILGNLKLAAGYMMRDLCAGMSSSLSASLKDYDNYMDDKSDPAEAVARAKQNLERAAVLAAQLGDELSLAQVEIARLGHRGPKSRRE